MTTGNAHNAAPDNADPVRAILRNREAVGALRRDVDIVVLEISRSGCLFESPSDIPPGTLAVVQAAVGGTWYADAVRVVRSQPVPGGGDRYRLGVEFAWLWPSHMGSLRQLAGRISSEGSISADAVNRR